MVNDKLIIPILNEVPLNKNSSKIEGCGGCSGGTCGAFGIRAGSEKNEVLRNILIFAIMGIGMLVGVYIIVTILNKILGV